MTVLSCQRSRHHCKEQWARKLVLCMAQQSHESLQAEPLYIAVSASQQASWPARGWADVQACTCVWDVRVLSQRFSNGVIHACVSMRMNAWDKRVRSMHACRPAQQIMTNLDRSTFAVCCFLYRSSASSTKLSIFTLPLGSVDSRLYVVLVDLPLSSKFSSSL